MILGKLTVRDFLRKTNGEVRGEVATDAKRRFYAADYDWEDDPLEPGFIRVSRRGGTGEPVKLAATTDLDEALISFFGLYSGDGAKGSEDPNNLGQIRPGVSFSQRESNLVRFAVTQFRRLFPGAIRFTFSLGEDSAFFMAGQGLDALRGVYEGDIEVIPELEAVRPALDRKGTQYLGETRHVQEAPERDLAFYYHHKRRMEEILTEQKRQELLRVGIDLRPEDTVKASLRRPYKKGAREPGGSSRSDETHVRGIAGLGELFLKMLHEVEESVLADRQVSSQGLVQWNAIPSAVGELVDVKEFFRRSPFGHIGGKRPRLDLDDAPLFGAVEGFFEGEWPRSNRMQVATELRLDPLWCYTSGLYLAEGSTDKSVMLGMYSNGLHKAALSFTSSENTSLELILRALGKLFRAEDCVSGWKVKVGSQYFPELVVVGLKNAVPMLRGGRSGDGKLRTMEISLAIKEWGLATAPALEPFAHLYSHTEPTGAGVPRVDFWASSTLCRWYFPLLIYATFRGMVTDPATELIV